MDDFSLNSLPSEVKSKQNQCLIKVDIGRFWLGDITGFIDHSAHSLISPLQSWGFSQEPCWRRGHQRLGSETGLQVKHLQKKREEKCPGLVLFSLPFCPLRVHLWVRTLLQNNPWWAPGDLSRLEDEWSVFPFFLISFFAEQARKQKISFRCALTHLKN